MLPFGTLGLNLLGALVIGLGSWTCPFPRRQGDLKDDRWDQLLRRPDDVPHQFVGNATAHGGRRFAAGFLDALGGLALSLLAASAGLALVALL